MVLGTLFGTLPKITSLQFKNLSFAYEGHDSLFQNVEFDFPTNEIVWVKADSGSGRSSLLQLMAGLQMPSKGSYFINEHNVTEMTFEEFLPYRLAIGYSFDFGGLINNRTLMENCTLALLYHKICSHHEADDKVKYFFDKMGVSKHLDKRPALVPGGVRKLTCLLRALILEPQMLLLDDPSVGLGQDTILKYFDLINDLRRQGRAKHVFISSFDDKLMGLLDHREIFIEEGQLHKHPDEFEKKVVNL